MRNLSGPEKAAVVILGLGEENAAKIFSQLDEEEIRILSISMSSLGQIPPETVEDTYLTFTDEMTRMGSVTGSYENTERMLLRALEKEQVESIMEEIRGPAGRTMWDKLANVNEMVLANYLKNEYPQTVAVILTKIKPSQAASVLKLLPDGFALEAISRMIQMESVQKEVLEDIERTLRSDFMSNLSRASKRDSHELIADIFNHFDRSTEAQFLESLEERNKDAAEKIKALMFTFEDIKKIDSQGIQTILRVVDKDKLGLALKGASDDLKKLFFSNMSERASKLMKDDMEALGPVKLKDVDEAQSIVVNSTKELIDKGEIIVNTDSEEEEMVY